MDSGTLSNVATISVWTFQTLAEERDCEQLRGLLGAEEQSRASHLHFAADRARYISAHAGLRQILARAVSTSPAAIVFEHGHSGKPHLASPSDPLYFNLSHSGQLATVAVSAQVEVGVDIEEKHTAAGTGEVLEQFCSAPERRWIKSLPAAERADAFYMFWTLKEALIKAEGSGVALPIDRVNVLDCFASDLTTRCEMPPEARNPWFATSLKAPSGYAGAVASMGRAAQVHHLVLPSYRPERLSFDQAFADVGCVPL